MTTGNQWKLGLPAYYDGWSVDWEIKIVNGKYWRRLREPRPSEHPNLWSPIRKLT